MMMIILCILDKNVFCVEANDIFLLAVRFSSFKSLKTLLKNNDTKRGKKWKIIKMILASATVRGQQTKQKEPECVVVGCFYYHRNNNN